MILDKQAVENIWKYVLKNELQKLVKRTTSPVDDYVFKLFTAMVEDWIKNKK